MAGGVLPWRDEATSGRPRARRRRRTAPTPVRGGWEQVPPSVSTEPGFGRVVDVGGARQFLLKIDTKDAEKKRASLEPGAYNYIASFNTGPGTAKPYRFDTSTKTGVNNIDPTKAVRLGIDDPEKIAEETTNLETAEIAEKFGKNTVGLVPRVCERLFGIQNNAHSVRHRAEQIVNKWCTDGIDAMMPHTVAACAILTAHMEKKGQLTSHGLFIPDRGCSRSGPMASLGSTRTSSRRSSQRRRASRSPPSAPATRSFWRSTRCERHVGTSARRHHHNVDRGSWRVHSVGRNSATRNGH